MTTSSYTEEQAAIMGRISDEWTTTSIAYPNTHFDPAESAAYIRPVVRRGTAFNASVSSTNRRIRHPGLLIIEVRVRKNTGDEDALDHGDALAALFRNLSLAPGIHFRAPTVRDLGPDASGWYVVQVECPFWRDSIH
jgi:hypothetical protein